LRFNILWLARGGWAGTTGGTRSGRVGGVGGVEPEHVDGVVVPDGENQDHTLGKGLVHGSEATLGSEVVVVTEGGLLVGAELLGDGIVGAETGNVGLGVLDDLAVLDVETADLLQRAVSGAI
jgi:hypothetical protein